MDRELDRIRHDVRDLYTRVRKLEDQAVIVATRGDVRRELETQTAELERKRESGRSRAFGRREKIAALAIALAVFGLEIVQTVWR